MAHQSSTGDRLIDRRTVLQVGAALATEGPPPGNGVSNGHASAAPACGYECPGLAGDGPSTGVGSGNGRADLSTDANQMLAGGRVGGGGDIHASAATQGGAEFLVASIRAGGSDF